MTLTHGADAAQLRAIAAMLTQSGQQATKVGSEGTARAGVLRGAWHGPDLDHFEREWVLAQRSIESAAERLTRMATLMREQADQQDAASEKAGAQVGAVLPTQPAPAGPAGPAPTGPPPGEGDSTFDEDVRGIEGQPVDKDLWALAHHSYGTDNDLYDDPFMYDEQPELPEGYEEVDPAELGIDPALLTEDNGMQAEIYQTPDGGYVVAYRGSDEGMDWVTNGRQGLGFEDPQYEQAMQLASAVHEASGGDVTFTGHSLGGGLAAAAAMATGQPAVTFDAAGVSYTTATRAAEIRDDGSTMASVMAETSHGQIRTYSMETDILTNAQEDSPIAPLAPDAPGAQITLETPESAQREALQGHYGDMGAGAGGAIGGVLGGVGGLFDGNPFDVVEDVGEGAQRGAGMGRDVGRWGADQVWGHHWDPMGEAMEERYPD